MTSPEYNQGPGEPRDERSEAVRASNLIKRLERSKMFPANYYRDSYHRKDNLSVALQKSTEILLRALEDEDWDFIDMHITGALARGFDDQGKMSWIQKREYRQVVLEPMVAYVEAAVEDGTLEQEKGEAIKQSINSIFNRVN